MELLSRPVSVCVRTSVLCFDFTLGFCLLLLGLEVGKVGGGDGADSVVDVVDGVHELEVLALNFLQVFLGCAQPLFQFLHLILQRNKNRYHTLLIPHQIFLHSRNGGTVSFRNKKIRRHKF